MNITQISKLKTTEYKYLILINQTNSYMGTWYGPPDPPPTMETVHSIAVNAIKTDKELLEWIDSNSKSYAPKVYQVISFSPVEISTTVAHTIN